MGAVKAHLKVMLHRAWDVFCDPELPERERRDREWEASRRRHTLTHSKCQGDAYPVSGSKDGYKCSKCGQGFRSVIHDVWY